MSITSKLSPVPLFDLRKFPFSFLEWLRQLGNYLDSGTYTPTLTNLINVASKTASKMQFLRVGKTVTVSGQLDLTPTVNGVLTALFLTLPIATFFADVGQCSGIAADQGTGTTALIKGVVSGGTAILVIPAGVTGLSTITLHFTYRIT